MAKKQQEQIEIDYPVALVVTRGNGTVKVGERLDGYYNAALGLWRTKRGGLFLPCDVKYANTNPCGESEAK